jgi:ABC-2 type transport system permease protein
MSATVLDAWRPAKTPLAEAKRLIQHRDLLVLLVQKELKVRYKGTFLGVFWSLLNPLLMMVVYSVVFSVLVRFSVPRYPIFILSALLPWNAFVASVSAASTTIVHNGNLIKRVHFPVEFLPLAAVLTSLVNMTLGFVVLLAFAFFYGQPLGAPLLALPVLLGIQLIISAGAALMVSALTVYFRDLEHLITVLLTAWFFVTPILYPASLFSGKRVGVLLELNPLAWLAAGYQSVWHDDRWPDTLHLLSLAIVAVVVLTIGALVFRRLRPRFAEEV